MTADLLSGFAPSLVGRSAFDHMPDGDQHWQPQYFEQLPMLSAQWPHTTGSGMQPLDLNFPDSDGHHYFQHMSNNQRLIPSPNNAGYPSDMDTANTPSEPAYVENEAYPRIQAPASHHLQLPDADRRIPGGMHSPHSLHSPHSSHSGYSPHEAALASPQVAMANRPPIERSITAPEQRARRSTASSGGLSGKHKSISDADDEEYVPNEDTRQPRGRKRQRIPHTAVERRYRENLNAHLEKLRLAVPALAARNGPGAGKGMHGGEGVKPSKCEILTGAIDHIQLLDKQMMELRNENQVMMARMEQMQQHWYRANSR